MPSKHHLDTQRDRAAIARSHIMCTAGGWRGSGENSKSGCVTLTHCLTLSLRDESTWQTAKKSGGHVLCTHSQWVQAKSVEVILLTTLLVLPPGHSLIVEGVLSLESAIMLDRWLSLGWARPSFDHGYEWHNWQSRLSQYFKLKLS